VIRPKKYLAILRCPTRYKLISGEQIQVHFEVFWMLVTHLKQQRTFNPLQYMSVIDYLIDSLQNETFFSRFSGTLSEMRQLELHRLLESGFSQAIATGLRACFFFMRHFPSLDHRAFGLSDSYQHLPFLFQKYIWT
jgi:hypothetical protein